MRDLCPHCGSKIPLVRDAYCISCDQPLDEPPDVPRTQEEQRAFLKSVEEDARANISLLARIMGFFGR